MRLPTWRWFSQLVEVRLSTAWWSRLLQSVMPIVAFWPWTSRWLSWVVFSSCSLEVGGPVVAGSSSLLVCSLSAVWRCDPRVACMTAATMLGISSEVSGWGADSRGVSSRLAAVTVRGRFLAGAWSSFLPLVVVHLEVWHWGLCVTASFFLFLEARVFPISKGWLWQVIFQLTFLINVFNFSINASIFQLT